MENTKNGNADCPGCGESAPQSAQARALKRAARALEESTVIVPYGQEATAKLPPNLVSRATLQSLEREIARTGLDRQAFMEQPSAATPRFGTGDEQRGPTGTIRPAHSMMEAESTVQPTTGTQASPLTALLTPRRAPHYQLAMTPGVGLQVQLVPVQHFGDFSPSTFFFDPKKWLPVWRIHKVRDGWVYIWDWIDPDQAYLPWKGFRIGYRTKPKGAESCTWVQFVKITTYYMLEGDTTWKRYEGDEAIDTGLIEIKINGTEWKNDVDPKKGEKGYVEGGGRGTKGTDGDGSAAEIKDATGAGTDYTKIYGRFEAMAAILAREAFGEDYSPFSSPSKIVKIRMRFDYVDYLVCNEEVVFRVEWWTEFTWSRYKDAESKKTPDNVGEMVQVETGIESAGPASDYDSAHK